MRKKLGVLGANGLLGTDLVKYLTPQFRVISITRENYEKHREEKFDILINANGNSKRYWANQNPADDFVASTVSVQKSIFDFPTELYIYISSPDIYENHTHPRYTKENSEIQPQNLQPYGFHKFLGELIVKKYKEKFLILRPAMILGPKLKKGPFYDVLNNNPLFISLDTKLQLVTTKAIAEIIKDLLNKKIVGMTLNIGGVGTFSLSKLGIYLNQKIQILPAAQTQIYEMNVNKIRKIYPRLKTSEEYLKDFLKEYKKL